MSDTTIPDALAADLRALFLAAQPVGFTLEPERVRLRHEITEPPSPRLVILTGDPKAVPRMDGTAKIPVSIEYVSSLDRVTPANHEIAAGNLDAWWRNIRAAKRRNVIMTRVYLHDLVTLQPSKSIRQEEREQMTIIRGELTVTLVDLG